MCSDEEKAFYLNRMWSEGLTPFAAQRMWGATARRVEELEFQNAVLREMPGDPKAGDPERLSNRRKAELGERLRRDYGFRPKEVLAFMRISKSSHEYERRALGRRGADDGLGDRVERAFRRRVRVQEGRLGRQDGAGRRAAWPATERRARDAMRRRGLAARRSRRPARWSSYAGETDGRPARTSGSPATSPRRAPASCW
ncbi:hypothetical protein [Parolsenella catena]|uniref:hypothetical protein n=1 Tax=Parolsenella catena TaxID=2003188 RepID=UPI002E7A48EC|nr:hypothetical protein [Parolsenella catena]